MRNAFAKEIVRSIRSSLGRFLAIIGITALGCGFFAGLQMSGADMRTGADNFYDGCNLYDLRVISTLGFEDADVARLRAIDGVVAAMPSRTLDAMASVDEDAMAVRVSTLNVDAAAASDATGPVVVISDDANYLNRLVLDEGRWPQSPQECVVSADAVTGACGIGSTVSLQYGASDLDDMLGEREFTIVGLVTSPNYPYTGSFGSTSVGSGSIEQTVFVPESAFLDDAVYTEVYLAVDGALGELSESAAYERVVGEVEDQLSDLEGTLAFARLSDVKADAQGELDEKWDEYESEKRDAYEQLDDAKSELDDARGELDDAESQLADSRTQLSDAESQLADSREQLADAERQLSDSRTQLDDAKSQLSDSRAQLDDAKSELDDAKSELTDAEGQLSDNRSKLDDAEAELSSSKSALDDAAAQIADGESQLSQGQADYAAGLEEYEKNKAAVEQQLADGEKELDAAQSELDAQRSQVEEGTAQVLAQTGTSTLADARAALVAQQAAIDEGLAALAQLDGSISSLQQLLSLCDQRDELAAQIAALEQAGMAEEAAALSVQLAQLDAAISASGMSRDEMQRALAEANYAREQLVAQLPADPDAAKAQLAAAIEQVDALIAAEQQLVDGQAKIDAGRSELEANRTKANEELAAAKAALDEAAATLASSQAQLDDAKAQYASGLTQYNDGVSAYEDGLAQYNDGVAAYEDGLAQYNEGMAAYQDGLAQYNEGVAAYEDGLAQYNEGMATYQDGVAQYNSGYAEYQDGLVRYQDGYAEYLKGLAQYQDGIVEYRDSRAEADREFADALAKLEDAQDEIDDLEAPDIYVLNRAKNEGAVTYHSDTERMDSIANVFPVMFFLVAALVSLTTMTRMVDDDRVIIGTYKALGYSTAKIASKYLIYAALASSLGALLGIAALTQVLPYIIASSYDIIYVVPLLSFPLPVSWPVLLMAGGLGVGVTLVATWAAVVTSLQETPANLMLPRAPSAGKRILLERITPIWSRLSFSWKVTFRNLFRYKRRMAMTVLGVSGCTALLLTGFGLHDAIWDIIDKQFGPIVHSDTTITLHDDATDADVEDVCTFLESESGAEVLACASQINRQAGVEAGGDTLRVRVIVPESTEELTQAVTFRERTSGAPITFDDASVVLTEKAAMKFGVSPGDQILLFEQDDVGNAIGEGHPLTVTGVAEYYVDNLVYVGRDAWGQVDGEEPVFSTIVAKVEEDASLRESLSQRLLARDDVSTVLYRDETVKKYRDMLSVVDLVVVVLIVSAAALAFIVLYNLTNINVDERVREIASLKVLGFTRGEVYAYIFREIALLSLLGDALGMLLGTYLERFVVVTAEVDYVMFGRSIHVPSYCYAFVLTMVFTVLVMSFMRRKLDRVDMVESLKSVD